MPTHLAPGISRKPQACEERGLLSLCPCLPGKDFFLREKLPLFVFKIASRLHAPKHHIETTVSDEAAYTEGIKSFETAGISELPRQRQPLQWWSQGDTVVFASAAHAAEDSDRGPQLNWETETSRAHRFSQRLQVSYCKPPFLSCLSLKEPLESTSSGIYGGSAASQAWDWDGTSAC